MGRSQEEADCNKAVILFGPEVIVHHGDGLDGRWWRQGDSFAYLNLGERAHPNSYPKQSFPMNNALHAMPPADRIPERRSVAPEIEIIRELQLL